jgi:hypothetical protein
VRRGAAVSGTSGSRAPAARSLLAALVAGAAVVSLVAAGAADVRSPRLRLRVGGWTVAGHGVDLAIEQHGAFATLPLTVNVAVDGRSVDRVATRGGRTRYHLADPGWSAGFHDVAVKCGTESDHVRVRVLPAWTPWAAGGGFAALLVGGVLGARFRRSGRSRTADS